MLRFYKFLALLYLSLFGIAFIYCLLAGWIGYHIALSHLRSLNFASNTPVPAASGFLKFSLLYGFITSLAIFVILALTLNKAVQLKQKFTVKKIITITAGFLGITSLVVAIYLIWCVNQDYSAQFKQILLGTRRSFARFPYIVFPLAWLLYYFLVSLTIKRRTNG